MPTSSADHDSQILVDELLAALEELNVDAKYCDLQSLSENEVCEVIQEMMRPWERQHASANVLNPQIVDVRQKNRASISLSECPVCDGQSGRPTFEIRGLRHRLLTCDDCGLGRLHPLPSPEEIATFYPHEYYGSPGAKFEMLTEAMVRAVGTLHVRSLSRTLVPGSRILDIGCGRGVLLKAMADRGHEVHGMDVSPSAVGGADPRASIRIATCLIEVGYPDHHFDQVILWHVLEHLRNPREILDEVHRILKPGGQIIIAVPNFSSRQARWAGAAWFHLDLPRHLFHFPVEGLRQLMTRTDFTVVREQHFSLRQNPFGWLQSAMNKSNRLQRNALYNRLHNDWLHNDDTGTNRSSLHWSSALLKAAYFAGMPFATALSLVDAGLRSGASVCLVGRAN